MNFVKRAYLYTTRKKVRTILLFSIILIMATLLIVCFSINSSSSMADANVRKALKCGFTVNAKTLENGLDESVVNQILNIDGITDSYNLRSYTVSEYNRYKQQSRIEAVQDFPFITFHYRFELENIAY